MTAARAELFLKSVILRREAVPSFDEYPFCLPAIRGLEEIALTRPVTFFVGENGMGKSTLLEAIAVAWGFNAEGGSRNFNFATRESHSVLGGHLRLRKSMERPTDGYFLRAESYFNVASEIERLDTDEPEEFSPPKLIRAYGGRQLHEQSHGESFMALLLDRFRGGGFYVLDEPEAALSPTRQLALLARVHDLVEDGSQFLIATHSPIVMSYPGAEILLLTEDGIRPTAYERTEHFIVTREFLEDRARVFEELFRPAGGNTPAAGDE